MLQKKQNYVYYERTDVSGIIGQAKEIIIQHLIRRMIVNTKLIFEVSSELEILLNIWEKK